MENRSKERSIQSKSDNKAVYSTMYSSMSRYALEKYLFKKNVVVMCVITFMTNGM